MKHMNIMLIHLRNIGGIAGGLEKVVCEFSNEMSARGHKVSLAIYDDSGKPPYYHLGVGVKLINIHERRAEPRHMGALTKLSREWARARGRISAWYESYRDPYILPSLREVYEECKPDVILNQYYTSSGFVYASHPPCPVINMLHNEPERILKNCSVRELEGMRKSALVQVLLPSFAEYVKRKLPDTPCLAVPNVVPQMKETADLETKKKQYTIIHVGRLAKAHKQQHLLIEAFAKVATDFPNWQVQFWGDGNADYKAELKQLIEKYDLHGQVFLCGTTHDVFSKYRDADIFAFPSAYEGWGLTLTEAMSTGLPPVVLKSCRACADLVRDGETGLISNDGADAFAQCLSRLMEDRELRICLGRNARDSVRAYAPEKVWDRWEHILTAVVSGRPVTE